MNPKYLALTALLLAPFSAQAIVWKLNDTVYGNPAECLDGCAVNGAYGTTSSQRFANNTSNGDAAGPNVTVTGVSTGSSYTASQGGSAASTFGAATLKMYGSNGLGVSAAIGDGAIGAQPDHAFDNDGRNGWSTTSSSSSNLDYPNDGAVDAGLFKFDQAVELTDVSVGYIGCAASGTSTCDGSNANKTQDADISVLAYTGALNNGALPDAASILGKTLTQLLNNSWTFIGNYNIGQLNTDKDINTGLNTGNKAISSSFWLITAYTSIAGTNANGGDTAVNFGNDYFKIASVSGSITKDTGSAPEPASLFLLASGLFGWRLNRKNRAIAA